MQRTIKTTQLIRSRVSISQLRNNQAFDAVHNAQVKAQAKRLIELANKVK